MPKVSGLIVPKLCHRCHDGNIRCLEPVAPSAHHHDYGRCEYEEAQNKEEPLGIATEVTAIIFLVAFLSLPAHIFLPTFLFTMHIFLPTFLFVTHIFLPTFTAKMIKILYMRNILYKKCCLCATFILHFPSFFLKHLFSSVPIRPRC